MIEGTMRIAYYVEIIGQKVKNNFGGNKKRPVSMNETGLVASLSVQLSNPLIQDFLEIFELKPFLPVKHFRQGRRISNKYAVGDRTIDMWD